MTIRNIPDDAHRALKVPAARNGQSLAAAIRDILDKAVLEDQPMKPGSELAAFGRKWGIGDLKIERDNTPAEPPSFD